MKKIILSLAAIFLSMLVASAETYYYSAILSCGKTVYWADDHQLSPAEILRMYDILELEHCGLLPPGDETVEGGTVNP